MALAYAKYMKMVVLMSQGIIKTLKNDMKDKPVNPHDTVEYNSYDSNNEGCMLSECEKCKTSNLHLEDFDEDESENEESYSDSIYYKNSAKICFYKWGCKDGKALKQ